MVIYLGSPVDEIVTLDEICRRLNTSKTSINRARRARRFPSECQRIDRKPRWNWPDIVAWLTHRKQAA